METEQKISSQSNFLPASGSSQAQMDAAQQKLHRIGAAKTLGKILFLTTASVFTVFPFVWMILSALKLWFI